LKRRIVAYSRYNPGIYQEGLGKTIEISIKIARVLTDILPNKSLKCDRYVNTLGSGA
jgi:hypothetical protein